MLQWEFIGRLHPLILHLPIGLIFGLFLIDWLSLIVDRGARAWQVCRRAYLLLLALSCVAAAVTGYVLSLEGQNEGVILTRHKWFGMAVAGLSVVLLVLGMRRCLQAKRFVKSLLSLLATVCLFAGIIVTGHLGGQLTHGPRFLSTYAPVALQPYLGPAPEVPGETGPVAAQATVYEALIQPILDNHCVSCHGPDRRRAQLAVHTPEAVTAGGNSGPVIVPGNALESEFFKRIQLPVEQAGHMPPQGKSQLSSVQISAIQWWIDQEASFDAKLNEDDVPRSLLSLLPQPDTTESSGSVEVPAQWDEQLLRQLAEQQISIQRIRQDDPRLWISFPAISHQVTDDTVKQLMPLAPFVAWLDLSNTQITSASLPRIKQMSALTELNLRNTAIDAKGLAVLAPHSNLERLNLSGVALDDTAVDILLAMPSLKRAYLWGSNVSDAGLRRLSAPRIEVITDATPSDVIPTDPNVTN